MPSSQEKLRKVKKVTQTRMKKVRQRQEDNQDDDLAGRALVTHAHVAADVTDLSEAVDDRVAALLVAGANITLTYDDPANTLTVAATAVGGGGASPIISWAI